jgi:glycosyltransferase involved in cell wall biosynthesis
MAIKKPGITAHMIVKNDDCWVRYAITSILPFVDSFLVTDTGSSDNTVAVIKSIVSPKITFSTHQTKTREDLIALRQKQLDNTQTEWLWMVDGDEIYPKKTCQEIVAVIKQKPKLEGIVVRRYDALGDVYHYQQNEVVGGYNMFGQVAHYSLRLVRTTIPGLTLTGEYPWEGFIDNNKTPLIEHSKTSFYVTSNRYLHTTYLKRSSRGENLGDTWHRQKYKIELGKKLPPEELPEVFITVPLPKRSIIYTALALLVTPLKVVKRALRP